ncbi:cytochrome b-c1 complex subunit 7-like [Dendroctonus ponderosae]
MAVNFIQKRFASRSWQEWAYQLSGFNKLGLWRDDLVNEQCEPNVKAALERLPSRLVQERNFRILRAVQLTIQKEILPKDQWTQLKDDKLYLTPYLEELAKEQREQDEWNKKY